MFQSHPDVKIICYLFRKQNKNKRRELMTTGIRSDCLEDGKSKVIGLAVSKGADCVETARSGSDEEP